MHRSWKGKRDMTSSKLRHSYTTYLANQYAWLCHFISAVDGSLNEVSCLQSVSYIE